LELVAVSKLVPYVNNARTHNEEQITKLRSSLREFGFINPVIIDKDYGVIAGHGRLMAAKAEGIEEVPCVFVDYLTEAQKKAYILADNRMAKGSGDARMQPLYFLITTAGTDTNSICYETHTKALDIIEVGRVRRDYGENIH
jgi:phage terminase large subunit-like protein